MCARFVPFALCDRSFSQDTKSTFLQPDQLFIPAPLTVYDDNREPQIQQYQVLVLS